MLEAEKIDATAKSGQVLPREALASALVDSGSQPVVTRSKVKVEKAEQSPVEEEEVVARSLHTSSKIQWTVGMRKVAKMEFPLIPLGVAINQRSKCKAKRVADWEESAECKFLAASCSPSVEQLHEKFAEMER